MNEASPLDTRPARALTDREIVKILCGTIGGLLQFCEAGAVRNAVRFLQREDVWRVLAATGGLAAETTTTLAERLAKGDFS